MRVSELMSTKVVKCVPTDDLAGVAASLWDRDVGAAVVVDSEHRPIGMVTDRDICMAAYTRGCTLRAADVGSLLGRPVVTCATTDTVASAAEAMALHQVRRLPVLDGEGKLAGVVSLGDIARGHRATQLAGAALAVITTPRNLAAAPAVGEIRRPRKKVRAA